MLLKKKICAIIVVNFKANKKHLAYLFSLCTTSRATVMTSKTVKKI